MQEFIRASVRKQRQRFSRTACRAAGKTCAASRNCPAGSNSTLIRCDGEHGATDDTLPSAQANRLLAQVSATPLPGLPSARTGDRSCMY